MSASSAWGVALLRVALGAIFVVHGYLALAILTPATTAEYITRMGYPPAIAPTLAWYLVVVHAVGGALVIVGLWTRLAALLQVPILASALFLLHLREGFFMHATVVDAARGQARVGGYGYPLLLLAATLALALLGGGAVSVDGRRSGPRLGRLP